MKAITASIICNATIAGALVGIYHLPRDIALYFVYFGLAVFAWALALQARSLQVNREAFGCANTSALPLLRERQVLDLYRRHSDSALYSLFDSLQSQRTIILLLSPFICWGWVSVALFITTMCMYQSLQRSWPGYVFILGASNTDSTRTITYKIQWAIRPLFATNLLTFMKHEEALEHTSFRIQNEMISWKSAVEINCALARIIILDASQVTEHVIEEVGIIDQSEFWHKCILICYEDSMPPEISALRNRNPDILIVEDLRRAITAVERLRALHPAHPTREHCLKHLLDDALAPSSTQMT